MTLLRTYPEDGGPETDETTEPAGRLIADGVCYERWPVHDGLAGAGDADVLAAYGPEIDRLKGRLGLQSVDIVSLGPDHPDRHDLRRRFLAEHTHDDFEVRFFVAGSGLFYIHVDDRVHGLLCEAGDLIGIPAGTRHWFDMGPRPDFRCIRLFTDPAGWEAHYTGDAIADRFPDPDAFRQAPAM